MRLIGPGRVRLTRIFLAAGVLAVALWAVVIEPRWLRVRPRELAVPGWSEGLDGLRVAILADLHAGAPPVHERRLHEIVASVNAAAPEIVVILGDFLAHVGPFGDPLEPEAVMVPLARLEAPLGVFAVLGNHDWPHGGERLIRAAADAGVRVLDDDAARVLRHGRHPLWLAGIADAASRAPDVSLTLRRVRDEAPVLALTHSPDVFPHVPARVSLTLAGHTHGGQVRLPIVTRRVVPSRFGDRYLRYHVEEEGRHLFVSPGVGTAGLPIRFRAPPEVTILTVALRG